MADAAMAEIVRFAPSPTGELHIGNVRTALYNAFLAKRTNGTFVLRYDDTDSARSEERFARTIAEDLAWLGIAPGRIERQSERLGDYDNAAERLRGAGLLYPAYETPEELDRKRALQRARGRPPLYDRSALSLTAAERAGLEAQGRRPHWRFKLPGGTRTFEDRCRGAQGVDLSAVSDPILVREDGSYLYTLPSVVDDIAFGVTTVVRGEDHVTNTGVQLALFEALGATPPAFAHHNLLVRADGAPLSKRDDPLSVHRLRRDSYEPMAVASLAALTGTSHPVEAIPSFEALAERVALSDVSRAAATFDPAELARLNASLVHALPADAVASLLEENGVDAAFWELVQPNLTLRCEVSQWAARLNGHVAPPPLPAEDRAYVGEAATALPAPPWDEETFAAWTGELRQRTGRKGKALFMPLRLALMGVSSGPNMGGWLLAIGPEKAAARLEAASAT